MGAWASADDCLRVGEGLVVVGRGCCCCAGSALAAACAQPVSLPPFETVAVLMPCCVGELLTTNGRSGGEGDLLTRGGQART